jgi:NAD(P) transhydrogenase subunit alpha
VREQVESLGARFIELPLDTSDAEGAGVTIVGPTNLPSQAAADASRVYARNLANFLALLVKDGALVVNLDDEVVRGALLTHEGRVANDAVRSRLG